MLQQAIYSHVVQEKKFLKLEESACNVFVRVKMFQNVLYLKNKVKTNFLHVTKGIHKKDVVAITLNSQ